jgi:hypothetical protein
MEIKVKYPHLFKFIIGVLQATLAFYLIYHFNFLNMVGYSILLICLEDIKKYII